MNWMTQWLLIQEMMKKWWEQAIKDFYGIKDE
jgi:hypothetical protein